MYICISATEPISKDRIPHRPRTAAEVARVRAQANMKSEYGMFQPTTTGLQMPSSMFLKQLIWLG